MVEMFKCLEQYRNRELELRIYGCCGDFGNGIFTVPGPYGEELYVIASDGQGWEHVSIHRMRDEKHVPNWKEMCFVKDLFWSEEDCVMQLHPPKKDYINNHTGVLHLWKPVGVDIPTPPISFV